jgi:hypothetical protein
MAFDRKSFNVVEPEEQGPNFVGDEFSELSSGGLE